MSTREQRHHEVDAELVRTRRELMAAKRAIALGKLTEFQRQCERLGHLIAEDLIGRAAAADGLYEAAVANNLVQIHGIDFIQNCLARAFGASEDAGAGSST